jgi:hypothetical protein
MAEIKSTLDLVLEKTRHLTFSDEERRTRLREEKRRHLQGRMLRYEQGALPLADLLNFLREETEEAAALDVRQVYEEIMTNLKLDRTAEPWLRLWEAFSGIDPHPLIRILEDYRRDEKDAGARRRQELARELRQRRGISGTAVVPNIENDPVWKRHREELQRRYDERLQDEKGRLCKRAAERNRE